MTAQRSSRLKPCVSNFVHWCSAEPYPRYMHLYARVYIEPTIESSDYGKVRYGRTPSV
jgi:hypothetical protein